MRLIPPIKDQAPPIVDFYTSDQTINERLIRQLKLFTLISIPLVALFGILASSIPAFLTCLFIDLLLIYLLIYINRLLKKLAEQASIKRMLISFIRTNDSLYDLDMGLSSAFSFIKSSDKLSIFALKTGDKWSETVEKLDVSLSAAVGRELTEKKVFPDYVLYVFALTRPVRLTMNDIEYSKTVPAHSPIELGYGVTYDPAKTPHVLISGGTGSGKTVLISYFLLEILRRTTPDNLLIADPKNADLGSLSQFLGDEQVAHTPGNIARVIKHAVEIMNERYKYMTDPEHFNYGANYQDHGYEPVWLIVDELGAFSASGTDKSSKTAVAEAMAGIKQIILLGRQAGTFVLIAGQQVNANVLSTEMRDNLGLRIALGSNSREGYTMVFGQAMPETVPNVEVKGSGLLYQQGSGQDYAKYFEAPYLDSSFDFIKELKKLI